VLPLRPREGGASPRESSPSGPWSAAPPVIELDVSIEWEPPEDQRGLSAPYRRWFAAVLVVLAVLVTMSSAAAGRSMAPVFRLPYAASQLVSAPGVLVALLRAGTAQAQVRAYRLSDFTVAWAVPVAGDHLEVIGDDTVVVLRYAAAQRGSQALDAGTGRELWQWPNAVVIGAAGDRAVLHEAPEGAGDLLGGRAWSPGGAAGQMLSVQRRTGRVHWSVPIGGSTMAHPIVRAEGRELTALVEVDADGQIRIRDPGTGVVRSATVVAPQARFGSVAVVGDVVVLSPRWLGVPDRQPSSAFGLSDGRALWRRDGGSDSFLRGCGPWFCDTGAGGMASIDPLTGATRWRLPDWQAWFSVVGGRTVLVRSSVTAWPPGQRDGHGPVLAVVDVATGRIQHEVAGWMSAGDVLPTGAQVVAQVEQGGRGRVGVLDVASGRVSLVGTVTGWSWAEGIGTNCLMAAEHLACWTGHETAVWRRGDA